MVQNQNRIVEVIIQFHQSVKRFVKLWWLELMEVEEWVSNNTLRGRERIEKSQFSSIRHSNYSKYEYSIAHTLIFTVIVNALA